MVLDCGGIKSLIFPSMLFVQFIFWILYKKRTVTYCMQHLVIRTGLLWCPKSQNKRPSLCLKASIKTFSSWISYFGQYNILWAAPSEFGTYSLCEQRRFRRACASAQSRQNLRCSLIQAVSQEEPSDRTPDPWPFWMAGHAQLKFVTTECWKTQIRLTGLLYAQHRPNAPLLLLTFRFDLLKVVALEH